MQVLHHFPHPSLPQLLDTVEFGPGAGGALVFATAGVDLHTLVRERGALPEHEARALFRQVVGAVAHCHAHHVVLRDLKLGKMFLADPRATAAAAPPLDTPAARVVLGDLDGAQCVSPAAPLLTDQRGSPAYVSPEVLSLAPYDGAAADVWALGVVLYVLVAGCYPFADAQPAALFARIQRGHAAVHFPPHLSAGVHALLCRLLAREPLARPAAVAVLADPWLQPDSPHTVRRRYRLLAGVTREGAVTPGTLPLRLGAAGEGTDPAAESGDAPASAPEDDAAAEIWEQIVPSLCLLPCCHTPAGEPPRLGHKEPAVAVRGRRAADEPAATRRRFSVAMV